MSKGKLTKLAAHLFYSHETGSRYEGETPLPSLTEGRKLHREAHEQEGSPLGSPFHTYHKGSAYREGARPIHRGDGITLQTRARERE